VKGWRSKLIFLCIIYFAGFATAVYMLAPPPEAEKGKNAQQKNQKQGQIQSTFVNFDSQEFVKSFNSGMHKCISCGKVAAKKTAEYIKEKAKNSELLKSASRDSHT
jgi:hypothetical protein